MTGCKVLAFPYKHPYHPPFSHCQSFRLHYLVQNILSHLLSCSLLQLCTAAPSSMPLAYRRTNWPWILREEVNTVKTCAAEKYSWLSTCALFSLLLSVCYWMIKLHYTSIWTSTVQYHMTTQNTEWTVELSHLQLISVLGRISPSQFHTDTAGALLQHRPHRKGVAVFCSLVVCRFVHPSARCCWDPFLLTVSM